MGWIIQPNGESGKENGTAGLLIRASVLNRSFGQRTRQERSRFAGNTVPSSECSHAQAAAPTPQCRFGSPPEIRGKTYAAAGGDES